MRERESGEGGDEDGGRGRAGSGVAVVAVVLRPLSPRASLSPLWRPSLPRPVSRRLCALPLPSLPSLPVLFSLSLHIPQLSGPTVSLSGTARQVRHSKGLHPRQRTASGQ